MTKEQMIETIQGMERELSIQFCALEAGPGIGCEETQFTLAAWTAVRSLMNQLGIEPCGGDGASNAAHNDAESDIRARLYKLRAQGEEEQDAKAKGRYLYGGGEGAGA